VPQTINGIGTWYYGKKNVHTRVGTCEHCGQQAELTDYETRLWFVFIFIPIIPLGRKQILGKCARCTRHRAVPLREWVEARDEAIQETGSATATDPQNPEAAMDLHGTLVAFQKHDEAKALADIMAKRFADNVEVQLHLGTWHELENRDAEADACFARAFELDPENPAARRAVGIACLQQGDLPRARELLAHVIAPGETQDLAIVAVLGHAYQEDGDHATALAFYQMVLDSSPEAGQDKDFRKRVQASEQALGRTQTLLPPKKGWGCTSVLVAAALAVLALLAAWHIA